MMGSSEDFVAFKKELSFVGITFVGYIAGLPTMSIFSYINFFS
jgi:hypothetical protein